MTKQIKKFDFWNTRRHELVKAQAEKVLLKVNFAFFFTISFDLDSCRGNSKRNGGFGETE